MYPVIFLAIGTSFLSLYMLCQQHQRAWLPVVHTDAGASSHASSRFFAQPRFAKKLVLNF
jgi:hypothetical protein